jgi:hypothetical protein
MKKLTFRLLAIILSVYVVGAVYPLFASSGGHGPAPTSTPAPTPAPTPTPTPRGTPVTGLGSGTVQPTPPLGAEVDGLVDGQDRKGGLWGQAKPDTTRAPGTWCAGG